MARGERVWWLGALTLAASFALAVRTAGLGLEPFWIDEACTAVYNGGTFTNVVGRYAGDIHPPLYGIMAHLWTSCFGLSEVAFRSYSVTLSLVGLLFAALLARDVTGNPWAAAAVGLVLAVNPLDVWHARDARMYAQAACLMTMAVWVLWRWLQRQDPGDTPWRLPIAYGVLAALLLHTHYVVPVVLGAQVLAAVLLFSLRRRWRDVALVLAATVAAVASFVPWVLFVHHVRPAVYSASHVGWIPRPSLVEAFGFLNHEFFLGLTTPPPGAAGWFTVVAGVLLGFAAAAGASAPPTFGDASARRTREGISVLLWLALGPALAAATISQLWHPIYFRPRFSLFCLAPFVVALVAMLARVRPPLRTLLLATITGLMATGAAWQAASPSKQGAPELRRLAASFGSPEFALLSPFPNELMLNHYLPAVRLQPSRDELRARLRSGAEATLWVCVGGDRLPPRTSADGAMIFWIARLGPHRVLGHADGFTVYELRALSAPPDDGGQQ